ncbi:MAG: extracellular solute-binding protein [Lachnospiraceae bacterium]|nr:extracellular solute-binding protein [Lachnospiraceae bacterium]
MGKISGRIVVLILIMALALSGCGGTVGTETKNMNIITDNSTPEELYERALKEDTLVVYTVSTRVVDTKEAFEKTYPGLFVEVRDLRSPNLIEEVEKGNESDTPVCDVVLCNDNSGEFKSRLVDTGIVVPFLPEDIGNHMEAAATDGMVSFLNEAEILFYSTKVYEDCPIDNIWELTEEKYRGRIYMPNPLRSFSTYAFCASSLDHNRELEDAYAAYAGEKLKLEGTENAAEYFWKKVSVNIIFTNSSDEVTEALNDGKADFGWCVSSKLRLADVGYCLAPVYKLTPFSGCRTSYAVMMTNNCKNENSAKLFIRFLLGEKDGQGAGLSPFTTAGTWSVRRDVPDGNEVPLSEIDLIVPDQQRLIDEKEKRVSFWTDILKGNR